MHTQTLQSATSASPYSVPTLLPLPRGSAALAHRRREAALVFVSTFNEHHMHDALLLSRLPISVAASDVDSDVDSDTDPAGTNANIPPGTLICQQETCVPRLRSGSYPSPDVRASSSSTDLAPGRAAGSAFAMTASRPARKNIVGKYMIGG
ncbi:hypothetical protein LTR15_011477 [Elasticomyces elasticus]|nr:hypothetical protein LTR15_011477 [Elasticomyces elasticus]